VLIFFFDNEKNVSFYLNMYNVLKHEVAIFSLMLDLNYREEPCKYNIFTLPFSRK